MRKTLTELHDELKTYTWRIRIENEEEEIVLVNGFSLERGIIIAPSFPISAKKNFVSIMGRRLNEIGFNRRLTIVFRIKRVGLVMFREEDPLPLAGFGTLALNQKLKYGEKICAYTSYKGPPRHVGCFIVGKVGFPSKASTDFDLKLSTSDRLCKNYVATHEEKTGKSHERVMGDFVNKETVKEVNVTEFKKFLKRLSRTIPVIQCNRFPRNFQGTGGPVINKEGKIIGMLVGGIGKCTVAIHATVIKRFVEKAEAKEKKKRKMKKRKRKQRKTEA